MHYCFKNIVKDLESYVLKINPYDTCVANEIINGKQMTGTGNVDGLKVSHKHPVHITKFQFYLSSIYGKELKLKIGKVCNYLGMDLDCS